MKYQKLETTNYTAHIFSYNVYSDNCKVKILYSGKGTRKSVKDIVNENGNLDKFVCAINGGPFDFNSAEKYFELFSSNKGQIQNFQQGYGTKEGGYKLLNLELVGDGQVSFVARDQLSPANKDKPFSQIEGCVGALQAYGYDFSPNYNTFGDMQYGWLSSNILDNESYYNLYNSTANRTFIGLSMDGNIYFITTEGKGMKGSEQRDLLGALSCIQGINLDGGYSCSMYKDNLDTNSKDFVEVVGKDSTGKSKLVTDCIAIYER